MRTPVIRARVLGSLLCGVGLALLAVRGRLAGACGLELLATAFWVWARSAPDRDDQLPRWRWLRRPAAAMWLAVACGALRDLAPAAAYSPVRLLNMVEAIAVLWAGLELLAALPLERPYSDRPGPLLAMGPWLPVLLPAAGFMVLWRHATGWAPVVAIRVPVLMLLVVTYLLACLRAFGRQRWVASLRWQAVGDAALGAILLARAALPREIALLLWAGAAGARGALLAGEIHGASPRRGSSTRRLWRLAGWLTGAALGWPVLVDLTFGRGGLPHRVLAVLVAAGAALSAWVSVRRVVEAPERRTMPRREVVLPVSSISAALTIATSTIGAVLAWWSGFQSPWPQPLVGALPALAGGGGGAWLARTGGVAAAGARRWGVRLRVTAQALAQLFIAVERRVVGWAGRFVRALLEPARDLHTGTAQEYLLFLVALGLVGLILPLLR